MRIEELISGLAEARNIGKPADEQAIRAFAEACNRVDTDVREKQRIRDIADLIDAEDTMYAQALEALDRDDQLAALPLLRQCAATGIGESAWLLGGVLEKTGKVPEALLWYRRAACEGDSRAEAKIAALTARPRPAGGAASPRHHSPAGPSSGATPRRGPVPFDERDLDAVLSDETGDVPGELRPVADTLAALRAAPTRAEFSGEADIMAEFRALGLGGAAGPAETLELTALPADRAPRRTARHRAWRRAVPPGGWRTGALAGAAAAVLILIAVAFAGNLPDPIQRITHLGHESTVSPPSLQGTGAKDPKTPTAEPSGSRTTAVPTPSPSSSSVSGLCRSYFGYFKQPESPDSWSAEMSLYRELGKLAGGSEPARVLRYCGPYISR